MEQLSRGRYDYVDPNIKAGHFLLTLEGERQVVLFAPKTFALPEEMVRFMKAQSCVPATLDDCLALGAAYPELQRRHLIVFLGSRWQDPEGFDMVPVLGGWNGKRQLALYWSGEYWCNKCRFAAVRVGPKHDGEVAHARQARLKSIL